MYIYIYTYIYMCVYEYVNMYMYMYIYICLRPCLRVRVHARLRLHVHLHLRMHVYVIGCVQHDTHYIFGIYTNTGADLTDGKQLRYNEREHCDALQHTATYCNIP